MMRELQGKLDSRTKKKEAENLAQQEMLTGHTTIIGELREAKRELLDAEERLRRMVDAGDGAEARLHRGRARQMEFPYDLERMRGQHRVAVEANPVLLLQPRQHRL